MSSLHRIVRVSVLVCLAIATLAAFGSGGASAATFFVNERGTSSTCLDPGINACPKISEAVAQAELTPGPNRIEVETESPGSTAVYTETVKLENGKDNGLTINGEEPGVIIAGPAGKNAVVVGTAAGSATLSNLEIRSSGGAPAAVRDVGASLTLLGDTVENEGGENGVEAAGHGSLAIFGGSVIMEADSKYAVLAKEAGLSVNGAKIVSGNGGTEPESGDIYSAKGTLAVSNAKVYVEGGPKTVQFGIVAEADSSVSIENTLVRQGSPSMGVVFEGAPPTVNGLRVEMVDSAASAVPGVLDESETGSSTFSHLEVLGTWPGPALLALGGDVTLSDSHLSTDGSSSMPALRYAGSGSTRGLLVQRSVLQAAPGATSALQGEQGNVTLDSSEVLGGKAGVLFEALTSATDTLTVSASTLDAGAPGTATDAAGVSGVEGLAKTSGSVANVAIQGSIVLEKQAASMASGGQASVTCSYSALPSQAQAASGGSGAIACANGTSGNAESNPVTALFAEPLTNYQLSSFSSAVDSIPAAATSLPFGIKSSLTDLIGGPRVVDGNGDCVALQDKGALELQGHSAPCTKPPAKPPAKPPVAGSITNLSISPNAFLAAPSGATIAKKKAKKRYGATVSYKDSQVAITRFTVLKITAGRMQGKSCKKPSRKNKHGKHCTLYKSIGSFTRVDAAGANNFHFSGRINGQKLHKGAYKLQAVPHNPAGDGAAVSRQFTIK